MAKYLTEDKSGIVSVLRSLVESDFEVGEVNSWTSCNNHINANVLITFKHTENLSDLEKDIMFPKSRFDSKDDDSSRFRKSIGESIMVELRGVRKDKQKVKIEEARMNVLASLSNKSKLSSLIQSKLGVMNTEIMKKISSKNEDKLSNLTRTYMNSSAWTWDDKEISKLDKQIADLRKQSAAMIEKRNVLRFKEALGFVKKTDVVSEVVREHLLEKMKESGSLDNDQGRMRLPLS